MIGLIAMALADDLHPPVPPYMERFYHPGLLQRLLTADAEDEDDDEDEAPPPEPPPLEPPPLEPPPVDAGGLDLEAPELGAPPGAEAGLAVGPLTNLVFGGTLDYRFLFSREMPEGMFGIHVNELFFTTNIGENISVLAEQLLETSELGSEVGQDHGFTYVIISNLRWLPRGTAIRVGRMRMKYGIDARVDAPANPVRTVEYRTIGILSDRAVEVSAYAGPVDVVATVAMGPDYVLEDVVGPDGEVAGTIEADAMNRNHPVFVRVGTDLGGYAPDFGLSAYHGRNYLVLAADGFQGGEEMNFGGFMDRRELVLKQRAAADVRLRVGKLRFAAEGTLGRDLVDGPDPVVAAGYFRVDAAVLPRRLSLLAQYDRFSDGRAGTPDVGTVSAAATWSITDESWLRGVAQANELVLVGRSDAWLLGTQLLVAF
ncbi:MAG: hypothetical protein ACOZNI_12650 [Myxococcota bacterium]